MINSCFVDFGLSTLLLIWLGKILKKSCSRAGQYQVQLFVKVLLMFLLKSSISDLYFVKVKVTQLCPTLCNATDYSPWNSPGQDTEVGSLFLPQGFFPTQWSNPGLPHFRQILSQLSHKGSSIFCSSGLRDNCKEKQQSSVWSLYNSNEYYQYGVG